MTLRNQSKAYNIDDTLNDEYSVTLFGAKYPLLSKSMKGYTSKLKKGGKARFNKLFNGSEQIKKEYIKQVTQILNLTSKSEVGDDMSNPHKVNVNPKVGKQAPLKSKGPKVPYDQTPDSIAVFQKLAKKQEPAKNEPEDQSLARQEAKKQEDAKLNQAQQEEALKQLLPNQSSASQKFRDRNNKKQMSKGGLLKGKSHKKGGIPMKLVKKDNPKLNDTPVDQIEVEGGEYIVNKKSTQEFKPLLKQINKAGNEARDAKGTPQENEKKQRLERLKSNLMKRKYGHGGDTEFQPQPPGKPPRKASKRRSTQEVLVDKKAVARKFRSFFKKYKGQSSPSGTAYTKGLHDLSETLSEATNKSISEAKQQIENALSSSNDFGARTIVKSLQSNAQMKQDEADEFERMAPEAPTSKPENVIDNEFERSIPKAPTGRPQPASKPSGGAGLMSRLSQDDNIKDTSAYPIAIGKYFTKLDFSRTLAYVKNKHKNVEQMSAEQLMDLSQDLASDLGLTLKYKGTDVAQLKSQLYQLLAIKLGRDKQKESNPNKTVGLVVDAESVFGEGAELDKNKIAKLYRAGGLLNVKQYQSGGTAQQSRENISLKQAMEDEGELEKLVKRGGAEFTAPKPESAQHFNNFQELGNQGEEESTADIKQFSFKRKTFDLANAVLTAERNFTLRHAEQINDPKVAFAKTNLFRKRRGSPKKRKNLLDGL